MSKLFESLENLGLESLINVAPSTERYIDLDVPHVKWYAVDECEPCISSHIVIRIWEDGEIEQLGYLEKKVVYDKQDLEALRNGGASEKEIKAWIEANN